MKNIQRILSLLTALAMVVFLAPAGAQAEPVTASIRVGVTAQGPLPETPETYTVRMTAKGNEPMPGGRTGGTADLEITGSGMASFPAITFNTLGVYYYDLALVPGKSRATNDNVRYDLTICVLRDETTDERYPVISILNPETQEKTDVPMFNVTYPEPGTTSLTVRKVWNDNNNATRLRPASLRVRLSNGMAVTLNEANGWSATIDNLPAEDNGQPITYTWQEEEVLGYTQTGYNVNGTETTITNTAWKPNIPVTVITEYDTPLGIGVEINHVGDTFD